MECAESLRAENVAIRRPWEVARWGRLLAGSGVLFFTVLGLLHHTAWLGGALAVSVHLIVTSLTDRCPIREVLLRLGAKEREDLFLPGGRVRSEATTLNSKELAHGHR
jgi:hypothetical protein